MQGKIKVLHIIVGLETGGAELMLQRLITHQDIKSITTHEVISLTQIGKVGILLKQRNVTVHALQMTGALSFPVVLFALRRLIIRLHPDIVQTWMYHADLLGGIAAKWAGVRHILWGVRTTNVAAGGSRSTWVVRRICAWLSYFVPDSIVCAAEASRLAHVAIGYDTRRMHVVPNGFDMVRFTATPE
jgi:Glycosyltransferase Family 4